MIPHGEEGLPGPVSSPEISSTPSTRTRKTLTVFACLAPLVHGPLCKEIRARHALPDGRASPFDVVPAPDPGLRATTHLVQALRQMTTASKSSRAVAKAHSEFVERIERRNPHQPEFVQAVCELAECVMPLVCDNPDYRSARLLERMTEPDRVISFRVCWEDDAGEVQVNRGWRVQFNSALGPYKGGLRFSEATDISVLKFLGFEQTFKNALTGLPMGGGKGGADFDPRGRSPREVMRFCKALMAELHHYIGPYVDVPAGDVGVGNREIGFLFGEYMRLTNRFEGGVLTGKGLTFGGSAVREEATGYGVVYFLDEVLEYNGSDIDGQRVLISGAGNVAVYTAEKAMQKGARVLTLSDSDGTAHCSDGFDADMVEAVKAIKFERRGRIAELAEAFDSVEYLAGSKPWSLAADVAIPCAIENEIDDDDARTLIDNDVQIVVEGANMPVTNAAGRRFRESDVLLVPSKAANAGGVAVSGLEQSQNAARVSWPRDEVDRRLCEIMRDIHDECVAHAGDGDTVDYYVGANRAGFEKVAQAMLAYGVV